jgi:hypothetical protein
MSFNRGSIQRFNQERLAKEDIRLLIDIVIDYADIRNSVSSDDVSRTRIELLLGKLKRMEKQK